MQGINKFNKLDIADSFGEYFGKTDVKSNSQNNTKFSKYMTRTVAQSIYFYPTDISEITKIIKNMKNSTSTGHDKINNKLIKELCLEIALPLEIIYNKSMLEGSFPNSFKHAHIIPVHKNGNKHELSNYRPIALLCCLSKILERIVFNRVYAFLEKHQLFQDYQFGFRKNMGTVEAVTFFLSKLIPSLDKKEYNLGLFIDLSKAFDKIDHKILLFKLHKLGIRGITHQWFSDYISLRTQSVRISCENNETILSKKFNISQGVPQGSILGPLLFLIYISDMPHSIAHGTTISYADDTTILVNNKCFEDLYIQAHENMSSLVSYLDANKLEINIKKTKYILFRPNLKDTSLDRPPTLIINNTEIMKTHSTKCLGIHIDEKLSWHEQVSQTVNKLKQNMYIFSTSKNFLPKYAKKLLYNAHVGSHLSYAALVWSPMINQTQANKIKKIMNNILLKINNTKKVNNFSKLYKELGILKFDDLVDNELNKFMYKTLNKLNPNCISNIFSYRSKKYNTRNQHLPQIAPHQTNLFNKSFLNQAIICFSRLPEQLKNSKSWHSFKKGLKKNKINKY